MVLEIHTGPATLLLGGIFLVVGSIVAILTEQLLRLVARGRGERENQEPPNSITLLIRVGGIGLAGLGAWLMTGSI